jgi:hypothetical protein
LRAAGTERVLGWYLVALVFGVGVASEADDRAQSEAIAHAATIAGADPVEDRAGADVRVALVAGERGEVLQNASGIPELETAVRRAAR